MKPYTNSLLLVILLSGITWAGQAYTKQVIEPELSIFRPMEIQLRTPAPLWDTNRVWTGATANLTRKVALGKYFKGTLDDTLRLVTVQSGGTRYLVIATDTMSTGFIKQGFRIETPYAFATGTPHAVAVGDVDGDEWTDILAAQSASPYRLFWFEWDGDPGGLLNWVVRDSLTVNNGINDITFGDGDNNPATRDFYINIAQTSPSSAIMRVFWTGTAWDTFRILLSGTVSARGVTVGDVMPELPGNEVYAVGSSRIWRVYFNGISWDTITITSGVTDSYDAVVGDVNPLNPGNELCVVHGSPSYYQISIWSWTGVAWSGTAWLFTTTWGTSDNDIAIGDVLKDNPGNELILTGGSSTTAQPRVFWYAPNGNALVSTLPKSVASRNDYGVAIGDVNRFRTFNSEFVLSGGGSLVEVEQHDFANDIGTYWIKMKNPTSIINLPDTINAIIFNSGSNAQSNFSVGYRFKNSPLTGSVTYTGTLNSGAIDSVKLPVTPDFLGMDTLYVFTNLTGDAWMWNDTTKFHIEVYDETTKVASGFNATPFPPANASISPAVNTPDTWWRTIISGTYNWTRYTSGTNPTCTPLEGYAMAGYPSYNASYGSQARLRTHRFNIGPMPRKVMLRFYLYHSLDYPGGGDSVIIEYSRNDITYTRVTGFDRYGSAGWYRHDVEIGDFPANWDLYIGFRARSGVGNNMFIDSVRVFVTEPTAPVVDAGIQSITPFAPPIVVNETLTVQVVVRNYGLQILTSTPVFYTFGGADTVWENWTGSLEINETAPYTFTTQFVPTSVGEETLYAGTRLTNDQNPDNDVATLIFTVCPEYHTLPYTKNFDEDWTNSTNPPFCGWAIVDGGSQSPPAIDGNDWHRYESTSPARTVARIYCAPVEWSDDWLISPRFDCSQLGYYTLSYWHWYNDLSTSSPDSGRVLLSTDGGTNWQTIAIYSNADDSGYKSIDVSSLVMGHNNIKIAFHYVARNEWWWYIDDFVFDFAPDTISPTITFVQQPQNTYQTGPYIVRARINDITGIQTDSLYYIVNDVTTAISHSSVSGDTFTFEIPGQASGTEIEYFVIARDNALNRASTGSFNFWVLSPLAPTDLVVTGQADSTVRLDWLPPAEEIFYYSEINYYWSGWLAGNAIATQYSPQYYPCRLEAAALLFYLYSDTIEFHIWADDGNGNPGTSLYVDTIVISQLYPNFEVIDLSQANITINSGSFHIGFVWLGNETPYPLSDDTSYTTRSKYYDGTGWYPAGYDWVMNAYVTYLPGAKRVVSQPEPVFSDIKVSSRRLFRKPIDNAGNLSKNLCAEILGISNFSVARGTTTGGPYTPVGTTTSSFFVDNTVINENRYYYVVKAIYTQPDTVSYYSNEANIGVDFNGPVYNNTTFDSMAAGPWIVSTELTDWIGIAYDSLAYRINGGSFTYVTSDSSAGNTYYYTIPDFPGGSFIEFYLFSQDTSWWQNFGRDPAVGFYGFTSHIGIADSKTTMPIPRYVFLGQCQPNPFDRTTTITYGIPKKMKVNISIYNAIGQLTKTLIDCELEPGYYSTIWDGKDNSGRQLANGIYFVRLTTLDKKFIKKAVLLH